MSKKPNAEMSLQALRNYEAAGLNIEEISTTEPLVFLSDQLGHFRKMKKT